MIPTNPPPTFRKPELWSDDFTDFVKKCLVKNPEQRATATQLLQVSAHSPKGKMFSLYLVAVSHWPELWWVYLTDFSRCKPARIYGLTKTHTPFLSYMFSLSHFFLFCFPNSVFCLFPFFSFFVVVVNSFFQSCLKQNFQRVLISEMSYFLHSYYFSCFFPDVLLVDPAIILWLFDIPYSI